MAYTGPTMVQVISDMGGVRVLISMKYGTTEVMYKNGLVRLSGDNTVSHIAVSGTAEVKLSGATVDKAFGICMNDKESGINASGNDMVDVLVFGRKDTLIGVAAETGGWSVNDVVGPALCIKAATEGNTAELLA